MGIWCCFEMSSTLFLVCKINIIDKTHTSQWPSENNNFLMQTCWKSSPLQKRLDDQIHGKVWKLERISKLESNLKTCLWKLLFLLCSTEGFHWFPTSTLWPWHFCPPVTRLGAPVPPVHCFLCWSSWLVPSFSDSSPFSLDFSSAVLFRVGGCWAKLYYSHSQGFAGRPRDKLSLCVQNYLRRHLLGLEKISSFLVYLTWVINS